MTADYYPLQVLLLALSGWVNRVQQRTIEYLVEENRVLKEQLKGRKLRLNDDQRRRLAAKGKQLGRRLLESGGDHRDARHNHALASTADRRQVDLPTETGQPARCHAGDQGAHRPTRQGERDLCEAGDYVDLRRSDQQWWDLGLLRFT